MENHSSKLLDDAVNELASLPGIGKKTALRLVLHLLKQEKEDVERFGNAFTRLRKEISYCKVCYNIADGDVCSICRHPNRDRRVICVVEDIRDIMAIENTRHFNGTYHVLGGIISPMDGIGPDELNIDSLVQRVKDNEVKELILALSTTMEGDTTNFFIYKKVKEYNPKMTAIARGIGIGDELEYADELTLSKSIENRVPYENTLTQ